MQRIFALAVGLSVALAPVSAQAQADFYKGKTVTVVVGSRVTGTLALAAQIVARHLGQHIPGNPTSILRQMPGGAHLNATNYVFNVAEADGLTILAANPAVATAQLMKVAAVRFDVRKFEWLGSSGAEGAMFSIRPDLPYKTFQELKGAQQELIVGTTGPGSNSHDVPLLLKEFAGLQLKLITGYAANPDIRLALERKEVDSWTSMATTIRLAAERGIVRPLVRSSRAPVPGLNHSGGRGPCAERSRPFADGDPRHAARDRAALRGAAGDACRSPGDAARGSCRDRRRPEISGRDDRCADRHLSHRCGRSRAALQRDDQPAARSRGRDGQVHQGRGIIDCISH